MIHLTLHVYDPEDTLPQNRLYRLYGFNPAPEYHYQHAMEKWYKSSLSGPEHRIAPPSEQVKLMRAMAQHDAGRVTVTRMGDWLVLRDRSPALRSLEGKLCTMSRKIGCPILVVMTDSADVLHINVHAGGEVRIRLSVDADAPDPQRLPMLSRMLGWEITQPPVASETFAALLGWTDQDCVRALCTATHPQTALQHLTKLMGYMPYE